MERRSGLISSGVCMLFCRKTTTTNQARRHGDAISRKSTPTSNSRMFGNRSHRARSSPRVKRFTGWDIRCLFSSTTNKTTTMPTWARSKYCTACWSTNHGQPISKPRPACET
ncbi:UNVERIFIED_CONTAM: hypothetical protein GTU68_063814 [Idotea baltica]|nr:hypothetical protein [Idotea baltica]